ncbi:adenylate/guanylate cyclase domain-containing protein, partial [Patulibacter sp. S7RM1-6]
MAEPPGLRGAGTRGAQTLTAASRSLTTASRRILGRPQVVARLVHLALVAVLVVANVVAAGISVVLVVVVVPGRADVAARGALGDNAWFLLAYLALAIPWVILWSWRALRRVTRWIGEGRDADEEELRALLRAPLRVMSMLAAAWTLAAVVFAAFNVWRSDSGETVTVLLALRVLVVTLLTGLTMAAIGYLVTERLLRPVAALALQAGGLDRAVLPGSTTRQLLGWATATGAPVLGVVLVGILALADPTGMSVAGLAVSMIVLGAVALVVGLAVELLAARAVADPVRAVRQGMTRVRGGDLDVRVPVYDASDLGRLQDGFNRMAAGLQDRARLRDLFGRHVGEEVARTALEQEDVRLGGQVREVCALFVDLVGSTALAAEHGPDEVVVLLNRFFGVVVGTTGEHGGWVNKFQGDAALVVFGAPGQQDGAPDRALRAARALATRLAVEVPELRAGVGVSGGAAVAGYVGAEERLEYTVIGDPINEAARLTEVAKDTPGLVAASGRLVAQAGEDERARWRRYDRRVVRGRREPTDVMVPAGRAAA